MVLATITIFLDAQSGDITATSSVSLDCTNQDMQGVIGQAADVLVAELQELNN